MMGLELVRIVSQNAWSEAWETSTSIPIRLHSRTTSRPKSLKPGLGFSLSAGVDPVESGDVGQREDPDPHAVIHPQDGQVVVDPARVEHGDHRDLAGCGDSLHVGGAEGQLHGIRVPVHALLQDLVDALQNPLDLVRALKQVVANVLAHLGRIDDSFPGVAAEDFFDTDSVDDGVDLAFLEIFQVELPVGVDDDGIAVELGRIYRPGRSTCRLSPGGSGRNTHGDG